jgi:hypothetical protein
MEAAEYRLYQNWSFIMMAWVAPILMSIGGGIALCVSILRPPQGGPPAPFLVFWLAIVGWFWFRFLRLPRRIVTHPDGRIEFIGPITRVEISARDISSIRPERGQMGFITVVHASGKVRLFNQFDGFHEFLSRLKSAQPSVEFRGC